jgi:hypothetical protein
MVGGIQVNAADNVVTLLGDAPAGPIDVIGQSVPKHLELSEPIARGHKAALCAIAAGEEVVKYGIAIGVATKQIEVGQWVHLHNCRSRLDERSSTLDLQTGAPTDTSYT